MHPVLWRLLLSVPLASPSLAACEDGPALAADAGDPATVDVVTDGEPRDDAVVPDIANTPDVEGAPDAESTPDTSPRDVEPSQDVEPPQDASPSLPLAGFGDILGPCGFLDTELSDAAPAFVLNRFDFGADPYDHPADLTRLTADGQAMMAAGNAGGSSILSEILAMEYVVRCEGGRLLHTETDIAYDVADTKRTDILVEIDDVRVGVSVTRAVGWPREAPYPPEDADRVLRGKLEGILESTANVSDSHRWVKQILHVFAYSEGHAAVLEAAWQAIPADLRADTVVIATVTDGADAFVYDSFRP